MVGSQIPNHIRDHQWLILFMINDDRSHHCIQIRQGGRKAVIRLGIQVCADLGGVLLIVSVNVLISAGSGLSYVSCKLGWCTGNIALIQYFPSAVNPWKE